MAESAIPAALALPLPRRVRSPGWLVAFGLGPAQVHCLWLLVALVAYLNIYRWTWSDAVTLQGKVDRLHVEHGKGGPGGHVAYTFRAGGQTISADDHVDWSLYNRLRPGDAVPVRVAHLGPLRFGQIAGGSFEATEWTGLPWIGVVILSIGLPIFVLAGASEASVHRHLARRGTPAVAQMTGPVYRFVRRQKTDSIGYAFVLPDGRRKAGKVDVDRSVAKAARPGDPILIVYDPRRPRRSIPYANLMYVPIAPVAPATARDR